MSNKTLQKFLAYGPEKHALETVMRLQAVTRWHMITTTRQQTLAEHSANVALLAMLIARTAPIGFFDTYESVAAAALVHDIPEAFTGDIPSHTKRYLHGFRELEELVTRPELIVNVNANSHMLIKMCDTADGIRFIRLHGVDMTAPHAREGLEWQIYQKFQEAEQSGWPEHLIKHVKDHVSFYARERS